MSPGSILDNTTAPTMMHSARAVFLVLLFLLAAHQIDLTKFPRRAPLIFAVLALLAVLQWPQWSRAQLWKAVMGISAMPRKALHKLDELMGASFQDQMDAEPEKWWADDGMSDDGMSVSDGSRIGEAGGKESNGSNGTGGQGGGIRTYADNTATLPKRCRIEELPSAVFGEILMFLNAAGVNEVMMLGSNIILGEAGSERIWWQLHVRRHLPIFHVLPDILRDHATSIYAGGRSKRVLNAGGGAASSTTTGSSSSPTASSSTTTTVSSSAFPASTSSVSASASSHASAAARRSTGSSKNTTAICTDVFGAHHRCRTSPMGR